MRPVSRIKTCSSCGRSFRYGGSHTVRNKHFFCCNECYINFITKKVEVKCDWCGISFLKKPFDVKRSSHNFCSRDCNLAYRREQGKDAWSHRVNGKVIYRAMVEDAIGRELLPDEDVHHVDGNHFNNAPENLIILSKSDHAKIHASWKARGEDGRFVKKNAAT